MFFNHSSMMSKKLLPNQQNNNEVQLGQHLRYIIFINYNVCKAQSQSLNEE